MKKIKPDTPLKYYYKQLLSHKWITTDNDNSRKLLSRMGKFDALLFIIFILLFAFRQLYSLQPNFIPLWTEAQTRTIKKRYYRYIPSTILFLHIDTFSLDFSHMPCSKTTNVIKNWKFKKLSSYAYFRIFVFFDIFFNHAVYTLCGNEQTPITLCLSNHHCGYRKDLSIHNIFYIYYCQQAYTNYDTK